MASLYYHNDPGTISVGPRRASIGAVPCAERWSCGFGSRRRELFAFAALLMLFVAKPGGDQAPATPPHPKVVRLTPADAARAAKEERAKVTVDMPAGLELTLWAPEQLVVDPVAIDLDERGTVYVTSSTRNNMPLDIRQHPTWFTPAHTLKTREDLLDFYRREMSPERSEQEHVDRGLQQGWLARLARSGGIQGAGAPHPGHRWRRDRGPVGDPRRRFQRRSHVGYRRRDSLPRRRSDRRRPAGRLSPERREQRQGR